MTPPPNAGMQPELVRALWSGKEAPPPEGEPWTTEEAVRWLRTSATVFWLKYNLDAHIEITIVPNA